MKKVYINGYFTCEHINGVPRYAMEIVKRLDQYFKPGEAELVIPQNAKNIPKLKNIRICTWQDRGHKKELRGPMWGLFVYGPYVNKKCGLNVNLSNRGEWVKGSLTALHDVISLRNDRYESALSKKEELIVKRKQFLNKVWFLSKVFIKKYTAKKIVTVSEFSKKEICEKFKLDSANIEVIGNGWEHIGDIEERKECFDEKIIPGEYFFFIGNLYPHKNLKWIFEEAKKMPNETFVIAGKMPYSITNSMQSSNNIIFLGYISDEYMKYLMKNSKALLFPSYIEGFGIPPLEMIAMGGKAIVADIPVMREIYKDSVYYINPNCGNVDLNMLLNGEEKSGSNILEYHNWSKSAENWFRLIDIERRN